MREPPSDAELRELPLRALVAYIVRVARRFQPCIAAVRSRGDSDYLEHVRLIATVLDIAERFCAGTETESRSEFWEYRRLASDASRYFKRHGAIAGRAAECASAAIEAVSAVHLSTAEPSKSRILVDRATSLLGDDDDEILVNAAVLDLFHLQSLKLGRYPEFGQTVDVSEDGPLGPLWPNGEPEWHEDAAVSFDDLDKKLAPLTLYFDPRSYSPKEIAGILHLLSDLYKSVSGGRLVIRDSPEKKTADVGVRVGG